MRRLLVFALVLASVPVVSHAQAFSVYFTSNNTRFSNVENGQSYSPNTGTYSALFTNTWPAQFGGGVTINGVKTGPVRLGWTSADRPTTATTEPIQPWPARGSQFACR